MKKIICIAGPTASGKSAYAVKLAQSHDGEIINADALQVYEDLQVLSARPTESEMEGIPHHLFGHIDASVRYSVGSWLGAVDPLIIDVLARGKMPILVGGTGLYYKALTVGLAQIPEPEPAAIETANALLREQGIGALRQKAEALDATAASRVLGDDPQRLLRIVNVALGTEKPLSLWQSQTKPVLPAGTWKGIALLPDRTALYEKINQRYAGMIENGGLDEARRLYQRSLDPMLPSMKAIGVRELLRHLSADISFEQAVEDAQRETRRFAKRQFTWLRGQMQDWDKVKI